MGELNSLERPLSAFIRLSEACPLGDLTEVPVATRFLYILLGPAGPDHVNVARYHEIGRAVATIMSDEVFHEVAYKVGLMMFNLTDDKKSYVKCSCLQGGASSRL